MVKPIKTPYHLYFYDPMFLEREGAAATSSKIPDPFTLCIQQIHGRIRRFIDRRSKRQNRFQFIPY